MKGEVNSMYSMHLHTKDDVMAVLSGLGGLSGFYSGKNDSAKFIVKPSAKIVDTRQNPDTDQLKHQPQPTCYTISNLLEEIEKLEAARCSLE